MNALARVAADHWAERDPFVKAEAHLDRLRVFHQLREKSLARLANYGENRSCKAALACVAKG